MPIDFNETPDGGPTTNESDGPMFAGVPAWERGKKRRGFGARASRVPSEPRSFASEPAIVAPTPATTATGMTGATVAEEPLRYDTSAEVAEPADGVFAAAPAYATRAGASRGSNAPVAIAAGIILLGGLGAAGWYYTQQHDQGVAELTPGSAATTTTTATSAGAPLPGELAAQNTAPPPSAAPEATAPPAAVSRSTTSVTTHSTAPHRTPTAVARARTAPRTASDVGADAAATAAPTPAPAPAAPPPAAAAPPPPVVLNLPPAPAAAPTTQAAPQTATPSQTPPQ